MNEKPLISGFTIVKNGLSLGYPIKESIESIEPLCDEIIINVGMDGENLDQDDGTYQYLKKHFNHPKFKFLTSHWDPQKKKDGLILSEQTNIAMAACQGSYGLYIQGDEAIHEKDISAIHNAVIEMENNPQVEGLVFDYIHFYGNVDVIKYTRDTYRREVRLIRLGQNIKSWKDAQGFRHPDGSKISCKRVKAQVYHYGWARKENIMVKKIRSFDKLFHGDNYESGPFQYQRIWGLKRFKGTHPQVMENWIKEHKNDIDPLTLDMKFEWRNIGLALSDLVEKYTGFRFGEYRNYRLL